MHWSRDHESIGYKSPVQFEKGYRGQDPRVLARKKHKLQNWLSV